MQERLKNYWNKKEERANKAKEHTNEMDKEYSAEINDCINNSKIYSPDYKFENIKKEKTINIQLYAEDSVTAIMDHTDLTSDKKCVLNFASYKNPGGMFINGSSAQEESLCHESFLYNVLKSFNDYYEENKKNLNKAMYTNRAIYSPDVYFIRDDELKYADVITCASPNYSLTKVIDQTSNKNIVKVSKEENSKCLEERIKFVLDIAVENDVDVLILGAYGCGVFAQDPTEVAELFKKHLLTHHFRQVIFAIPDENSENYLAFKKVFKK